MVTVLQDFPISCPAFTNVPGDMLSSMLDRCAYIEITLKPGIRVNPWSRKTALPRRILLKISDGVDPTFVVADRMFTLKSAGTST